MSRGTCQLLTLVSVGVAGLAVGVLLARFWPAATGTAIYRSATGDERGAANVPSSFADVVERASAGIVSVQARLRPGAIAEPSPAHGAGRPVYAPEPDMRNGSGFVVHEDGLVVTSRHVVTSALSIQVLLAQHGAVRAELVGEDPATDLALLRLVDPPSELAPLAIGDSRELRAGDWIVAVGNPFGFAQTVTAGVVSFVGRHLPHSDFGVTNDFLQFSAPVNPGSSGGPVLDLAGRVVGVTTQAASEAQGISFAVPSHTLQWALEAMERHEDGRVRRGYLGIEFASRAGTDDVGLPVPGALIVRVAAGEAADRAGLRRGDVVLRVDGHGIADAQELHEQIVCRAPGTRIQLALLRDGEIHDPIEAVLGEVGSPRPPGRAQ